MFKVSVYNLICFISIELSRVPKQITNSVGNINTLLENERLAFQGKLSEEKNSETLFSMICRLRFRRGACLAR